MLNRGLQQEAAGMQVCLTWSVWAGGMRDFDRGSRKSPSLNICRELWLMPLQNVPSNWTRDQTYLCMNPRDEKTKFSSCDARVAVVDYSVSSNTPIHRHDEWLTRRVMQLFAWEIFWWLKNKTSLPLYGCNVSEIQQRDWQQIDARNKMIVRRQ